MRRTVEKVLSQHGTDLTIVSGLEQKTVRGFFRAVNSKSWQSMESEATLLGEITRGQYVYMGPVSGAVKEGDTPEVLQRRIMEEAEWKLLPEAVSLFCQGRIQVEGRNVIVKEK